MSRGKGSFNNKGGRAFRGRPRDLGLPERRRAQILDAAVRLFAGRGYQETDLDAVTKSLGCGKGTIYRYFRSKEELFLAAVARCMRELGERTMAAATGARDPEEKIRAPIREFLSFFDENPDYAELLMQERTHFRDRRNLTHERMHRETMGEWRAFVRGMVDRGHLRDMPVERMARVASNMLFGALFTKRLNRPAGKLKELADEMIDVILNGIRPRRPVSGKHRIGRALRAVLAAGSLALSAAAPVCAEPSKLSVEDVIALLLKDNLAFKILVQETVKADSEYLNARETYAPKFTVASTYMDQSIPMTGMTAFLGNEQYQWDTSTSVFKQFMTGTTVTLAVRESLFDANDPAFGDPAIGFYKPADPPLHSPVLSLSLSQELLRNAFGFGDRRTDESLKNLGTIKRRSLISQASDLALMVLAGYWKIGVEESAVRNAEEQLAECKHLLDTARENVRFGKTQEHELHQFNAMVLAAEIKVAQARQARDEARRDFERLTHVSPDTELTGVTDLVDELPALDREQAVRTALSSRVDYLNAELALASAELSFEREKNAALPSLSLVGGLSSVANREVLADALGDAGAFKYPSWSIGLNLSYSFGNPGRKARLRDAWLLREQNKLNVSRMREEVRDDVLSKLEKVELAHTALIKVRQARGEAEAYYAALLEKSRQGKASAFELKQALDGLTEARQQSHAALVGFNLAILQYNRAQERFFEYYGVDLDALIGKLRA